MKKIRRTKSLMSMFLNNILGSYRYKIEESTGEILTIEYLMRFLGEISDAVQAELAKVIAKLEEKPQEDQYWNCNLNLLEKAILNTHRSVMTKEEINLFKDYRKIRNKIMHADFVNAMIVLGIEPGGPELKPTSRGIERVPLDSGELEESVKAFFREDQGLRKLKTITLEMRNLLHRFCYLLCD